MGFVSLHGNIILLIPMYYNPTSHATVATGAGKRIMLMIIRHIYLSILTRSRNSYDPVTGDTWRGVHIATRVLNIAVYSRATCGKSFQIYDTSSPTAKLSARLVL
jgi:hypothetical protein